MNNIDDEREIYILHTKLPSYKNRIQTTMEYVKEVINSRLCKQFISFSGGKDSIVLTDILGRCGFKGEMVTFTYGLAHDQTPPDTYRMIDFYSEKWNIPSNIVKNMGDFDVWDSLGYFTASFESTEERRALTRKMNHMFHTRALFDIENNIDLLFLGLRGDESRARMISRARKGQIYVTRNRDSETCCPLAWFSDRDIWGYIFSNDLPYPSVYDYPYMSREKIRNEPTFVTEDFNFGMGASELYKQCFPEYIGEIRKRYTNFTY